VAQWTTTGEPMELVTEMWNHAATMRREFASRKISWPELTSQDLSDMLVYLRNLPATRNQPSRVEITSGANGQTLFESKGCALCHTGSNTLVSRLRGQTLTDIAVEMWNHAPRMAASPPSLSAGEMREITSFLWAGNFFEDAGSASAGERVFNSKHCAVCHNDPASGAPKLTGAGRTFTGATMVSALWRHGPRMLEQMNSRRIGWPRFEGNDMGNLIAYLNSRR
jgi:cytochrome c5